MVVKLKATWDCCQEYAGHLLLLIVRIREGSDDWYVTYISLEGQIFVLGVFLLQRDAYGGVSESLLGSGFLRILTDLGGPTGHVSIANTGRILPSRSLLHLRL